MHHPNCILLLEAQTAKRVREGSKQNIAAAERAAKLQPCIKLQLQT